MSFFKSFHKNNKTDARMSLYYKKCKLCNKKKPTSNVHSCTSCEQL